MNGGSDLYRNSHSSKLAFTSDGLPFYRRNGNQKENGREAKRMPSNTYPNGKGKGKQEKDLTALPCTIAITEKWVNGRNPRDVNNPNG